MFFIMGVSQKQNKLEFDELTICKCCGKYGHIEVFMSYCYFMFFFIPLFKWNKEYFIKMSCCNQLGKLDNAIGRKIERKEQVILNIEDIDFNIVENSIKGCTNCGYTTDEDFNYCPKCSTKL